MIKVPFPIYNIYYSIQRSLKSETDNAFRPHLSWRDLTFLIRVGGDRTTCLITGACALSSLLPPQISFESICERVATNFWTLYPYFCVNTLIRVYLDRPDYSKLLMTLLTSNMLVMTNNNRLHLQMAKITFHIRTLNILILCWKLSHIVKVK